MSTHSPTGAAAPVTAEAPRTVLRGGTLVDPESGTVTVGDLVMEDGRITAVGDAQAGGDAPVAGGTTTVIDVTGRLVVPGFIDLHSHAQNVAGHRLQVLDGLPAGDPFSDPHSRVPIDWFAHPTVLAGATPSVRPHPPNSIVSRVK